ncbi:MAG: hypothetical protein M1484_02660 [Patescibacteria group bacterium]|nr:hypothetical protein [Patescibacteria group bacterium]MCL5431983.1 hypothetical protein [Patescibacteria group bacterium]
MAESSVDNEIGIKSSHEKVERKRPSTERVELARSLWATDVARHALSNDPYPKQKQEAINQLIEKGYPPIGGGAWANDEFITNPNAALRVGDANIVNRVIAPLNLFEHPTSQNLNDALKALGELVANGTVNAGDADVIRVASGINTQLTTVRSSESMLGSPELPPNAEGWRRLVREQISLLEQTDVLYPPTQPWDQLLELKSPSGLTISKALEKMQPAIANIPVHIVSEGANTAKTLKERLTAECRARQTLHNRFMIWRGGAPVVDAYTKVQDLLGQNSELTPDHIESIAAMLPPPGQGELTGDRVSKAFWAYRMIARGQPYDGVHTARNIFSEYLSPEQEKIIHDAVKVHAGNDEDAERLGWRLAHVWREAASGDNHAGDMARGAKTSDSDATSRLTYFEQWRKQQFASKTERSGGPKETLTGCFPKKLLLPMLDTVPYAYINPATGAPTPEISLREAMEADPNHLLRNIKWHGNILRPAVDLVYAINVSDAAKLFTMLTGYGISKEDLSEAGLRKTNKLVDDVIGDVVVAEELMPGSNIGYWNSNPARKARLNKEVESWRHKVRYNYVRGVLKSAGVGLIGGSTRAEVVTSAIRATTIGRGESLTI